MSADCGKHLSISKHVATQVSMQAWPSHSPIGPMICLMCVYVHWYNMHYVVSMI